LPVIVSGKLVTGKLPSVSSTEKKKS